MKFCVNVSVVWRVCLQSISVGAEYQADLPDLITSTDPPGTCVIIDITISVVTVPKFSLTVGYGEFWGESVLVITKHVTNFMCTLQAYGSMS